VEGRGSDQRAGRKGAGRSAARRGELSITSLIADYDGMTGQPYPHPNRAEVVNVSGYPAFRQVAWADSDRHFTYFGLGVGPRLALAHQVLDAIPPQ
jgi:hypothetical protein